MMNRSIPTFELFGELLAGSHTDPIHHETIEERSSKHNWTIRLHRHSRLAQIFIFQTPGVFVRHGDQEYTSTEPMILVVPSGIAPAFRFSEDVVGDVLSLRMDEIGVEAQKKLKPFSTSSSGILSRSNTAHFDHIAELISQLRTTYHAVGPERTALLTSITQLILTYLFAEARAHNAIGNISSPTQLTRHEAQAERFCVLIEGNFDKSWVADNYAKQVGISAPHLTRICKRVLGSSPIDLVRQRRILEAKRLLEYTRLPISEIAHRSGFRDAAFFSRTFKRIVGQAPQAYRLEKDQ
jgi:AraC family transcriptional activator of pobA